MTVIAQLADQHAKPPEGRFKRRQGGQLATDMDIDALDAQPRHFGERGIGIERSLVGNAELVFRLAGRNLGVSQCIYIGIDPVRDTRNLAHFAGNR